MLSTFRTALILVFFSSLLLACGKKGPVRPLNQPEPAAVETVELTQQGNNLQLSWSLPSRNRDGSVLTDPPVVEIYRSLYEPENDCPSCPTTGEPIAIIDPDYPAPATLERGIYRFIDSDISPGQGYRYRLIPRTAQGQAGAKADVNVISR
ncbi:MAG: hypothetical protein C0618_02900 [Desulfuromonas sp.]|nr:MAG: hypothetical protein C0618_02900 [Desulfuromonas sp.]